jgi:putative hydrolase of the HAD superfamily
LRPHHAEERRLWDTMIKAVIFDIDDTLKDHEGTEEAALRKLFTAYTTYRNSSMTELITVWREQSTYYLEQYLSGNLSLTQQRIARIQAIFTWLGKEISEHEATSVYERYLSAYETSWTLHDDVVPCLESLKEYTLGIISNGDSKEQRLKLDKMGIRSYFSSVVISDDLGVRKPAPAIFEASLRDLGVSAKEAVYIGDRVDKDMAGAQHAGIPGVLIDRKKSHKASASDSFYTVHSLLEIKDVIKEIGKMIKNT